MCQVCDAILSIVGEKCLLCGHIVSYKVMGPQCVLLLKNNNAYIMGQNDPKITLFKVQKFDNE